MKKMIVIAGTRPEAIKLSPILKWLKILKIDFSFVWSGQHYDYSLSEIFFKELDLPKPDLNLNVGSGNHSEQTAKVMIRLQEAIRRLDPSLIIAQGDTNTVLASALTANKCQIPFAHVEAGLRSYDKTMPEETNRIVADSCADLLFAPTNLSVQNLIHEGVSWKKIHLTGNTVVDVVKQYSDIAMERGIELLDDLEINPKEFLLLTLHRQESTEVVSNFRNLIHAITSISEKYKIIFPIHPRTRKKLDSLGFINSLKKKSNLIIIPPLGYFKFLGLLSNSLTVITDSGGIQEEAVTLGVPTVTLRFNTERPESVHCGVNVLTGTNPQLIIEKTENQIKRYDTIKNKSLKFPNPFGDGDAGKKISIILKSALESGIEVEARDTREDPYLVCVLVDGKKIASLDRSILNKLDFLAAYDSRGNLVDKELRSYLDSQSEELSHKVLVRVPIFLAKKLQS